MLREAFNSLTSLHSRPAQLKRPGSPDIYSPCRISPSNYSKYKNAVEGVVVRGREFVIPFDTLLGQFAQSLSFSSVPVSGDFKIRYNGNDTSLLTTTDTAATIQTALRLLAGLSQVLVTGNFTSGFSFVFPGFAVAPLALSVQASTLENVSLDPVTSTIAATYSPWANRMKRGDKIVDSVYNLQTISQVEEMVDVGGAIMGYRVTCE